jgi:protein SCO1/2
MKRKVRNSSLLLFAFALVLLACNDEPKESVKKEKPVLPFFGDFDEVIIYNEKGEGRTDTVFMPIPKFAFTNQNGELITREKLEGKIVLADFFFTHCESICPLISTQMVRLQERLKAEGLQNQVIFISHTVDPKNDTPEVMKNYANQIGADLSMWNFVTGMQEDLYELAQEGYKLTAFPSDTAQGGFFHTDQVALLDQDCKIRGYYDGTSTKSMDQLFSDLHKLLK